MRYLPLLLSLIFVRAEAELSVVTSIRPIYQLTTAIMDGVGKPELLISDSHSTHHFALKPSHFRLLEKADLVIWIDRGFEAGFRRLPQLLPDKTSRLELLPALGMQNQDGHIWYSAALSIELSELIAARLGELDSENRQRYEKNKQFFQTQINRWREDTLLQFGSVQPAYVVDHDFLQHFESEFGIKAVAVLHDNHAQHGGIRALQQVHDKLRSQPVKCLISNEDSVSPIGKQLAAQYSLAIHTINTITDDNPSAYLRHLIRLTEIIGHC